MKEGTHFAVTTPFKLLDFKKWYNGVCRVTSNFGNTGGGGVNMLKNLFYYNLQTKITNRIALKEFIIGAIWN